MTSKERWKVNLKGIDGAIRIVEINKVRCISVPDDDLGC